MRIGPDCQIRNAIIDANCEIAAGSRIGFDRTEDAKKFKARYATLGFNDKANLDEGNMWPTSFALKELTATEEARIIALIKKAVS